MNKEETENLKKISPWSSHKAENQTSLERACASGEGTF